MEVSCCTAAIMKDPMRPPLDALREATRLTRLGQLAEATRVIQRALAGDSVAATDEPATTPGLREPESNATGFASSATAEDVPFRDLPVQPAPDTDVPAAAPAPMHPRSEASPPPQAPGPVEA